MSPTPPPVDTTAYFPPPDPRHWAARLLRAFGWTLELAPVPATHVMVAVYPHTSNWDFPLGLLTRFACRWPIHWVGKAAIFAGPWRGLLRRWGGIPVDRSAAEGFAEALAGEFARRDHLMVAIAPEGTRRHVDALKSGFYRIALAANAPIGLGYIDYGKRRIGIGGYFTPSGDTAADLEIMQRFYADKRGRYPAQAGNIRFR